MTRHALFFCVSIGLIVGSAMLTSKPENTEVDRAAVLDAMPMTVGTWVGSIGAPGDVLPPDPGVGQQLTRTYREGGAVVWVSVGYYPDQRERHRPAARALLFPGHGWTTLSEQLVTIPVDDIARRSLRATMVVSTTTAQRTAVLYWYQFGATPVASDHWYRTLVLFQRVVHGRAPGALIRIAWPLAHVDPGDAVQAPLLFIRAFYPALAERLVSNTTGGGRS